MLKIFNRLNRIQKIILIFLFFYLLRETVFRSYNNYSITYNYNSKYHSNGTVADFSKEIKTSLYGYKTALKSIQQKSEVSINYQYDEIKKLYLKGFGTNVKWTIESLEINNTILPYYKSIDFEATIKGHMIKQNFEENKSKIKSEAKSINYNIKGNAKIEGFSSMYEHKLAIRNLICKELIKYSLNK